MNAVPANMAPRLTRRTRPPFHDFQLSHSRLLHFDGTVSMALLASAVAADRVLAAPPSALKHDIPQSDLISGLLNATLF